MTTSTVPGATEAPESPRKGRDRPRGEVRRYSEDDPGTISQRLFASFVAGLSGIAQRFPDRRLHRVADAAGAGLYLVSRRRSLVRANLERVCQWLDANGMASARVSRAAHDPRALDRLVRDAFRHYARYYLEVALAPVYSRMKVSSRLSHDTPDTLVEAFDRDDPARPGRLFLGLHLGAIELPGAYTRERGGRPVVAPMETIENAPLQRYFKRSRAGSGITIISHLEGSRPFLAALDRGDTVAMIADRDVSHTGHPVTLFGATTLLPAGPAVLAIQTGVPVYAAAIRRVGYGDYRARLVAVHTLPEGRLRERVAGFLESQARAYERLIADAPEQWWSIFFPIWTDLDGSGGRGKAASA